MTVIFENESKIPLPEDYEALAKRVIGHALDYCGCPYETEINILLTTNREIVKINKQFREIDQITDVLSFPTIYFKIPGNFSEIEEEDAVYFNPDSGELLLGDIMISAEMMLEQAAKFGHRNEREFAFLIVHSVLHLLGWDHIDPVDAEEMEQKQREILEELHIFRE